jgi:predicted permease
MPCDPDLTSPIAKFFGCGTSGFFDWVFGSDPQQQINAVVGLMIFLGMIIVAGFYVMWREARKNNEPFWMDLNDSAYRSFGYSGPPPLLAIGSGMWAISEYFHMSDKYFHWYYLASAIIVCMFWIGFTIILRYESRKEKEKFDKQNSK